MWWPFKKNIPECEHEWTRTAYFHNQEEANEPAVKCLKCGKLIKSMDFNGSPIRGFWNLWDNTK
jgi:ssDNA-binding Zn-finger/Zn-ribbon topoisomerase 1